MKVTPLDIRRKEFKRSLRGYADEEVDVFLDEVADEFERLFQENIEIQDRIQRLEEQVASHAQLKGALEKTLVSAQLQADQLTANARKEGELILRDAELKARNILSDSYAETQRVQQALIQLKHLEEDFRFKFRSLLEGHLKLLNEAPISASGVEPIVAAPQAVAEQVAIQGEESGLIEPQLATLQSTKLQPGEPLSEEQGAEESQAYEQQAVEQPPAENEAVERKREESASAESGPAWSPVMPVVPEPTADEGSAASEPVDEVAVPVTESAGLVMPAAEASPEVGAEVDTEATAESVPVGVIDELLVASTPFEDLPGDEDIPTAESDTVETERDSDEGVILADSTVSVADRTAEFNAEVTEHSQSPEDEKPPVRGFFFGRQLEDIDDTFPSAEVIKDKSREFEW